jgi:hypothetical protein
MTEEMMSLRTLLEKSADAESRPAVRLRRSRGVEYALSLVGASASCGNITKLTRRPLAHP